MTGSADLRRLLAGATPGPWRDICDESDEERAWILSVPESARLYVTPRPLNVNDDGMLDADAALIVYLVNHASALADLIDAAPEAAKCLYAAYALADGYDKPQTADRFKSAHDDLAAALAALKGTK